MSHSWPKRKARLRALLQSQGDEDEEGLALDRILHGQSVIGKSSKSAEIDATRFHDRDLSVVGALDYGQFGVIDVVNCRPNGRVYVRKSTEKQFALRTRDQCSPKIERDLLLRALRTETPWVPHLLCAYQTPTHLNLVMDYVSGGTLWDVLESSPHEGRVPEADLLWWTPQIVSAINWCHTQGFVHRDIKPHNFVLTPEAHVMLIDFGSAAPLLPPEDDGTRKLDRKYCAVPCGTCDYISPEILELHERALVAMEMEETLNRETYGLEADWWSLGAMLYEMAYGVAPFFAEDIRRTYVKIIDHQKSLHFPSAVPLSEDFKDLLRRLLTDAEFRLGRHHISEITDHPVFMDVAWTALRTRSSPPDLHVPQFTYGDTRPREHTSDLQSFSQSQSNGFAFSALFQSSPAASALRNSASDKTKTDAGMTPTPQQPVLSDSQRTNSFIGFSWGPTMNAFPPSTPAVLDATPMPGKRVYSTPSLAPPSMLASQDSFSTPVRPGMNVHHPVAFTLPRTGIIHRTVPRRRLSDREAMKQLMDCVGMSARKKVLESGKKPRHISPPLKMKPSLRFTPSIGSVTDGEDTHTDTGSEAPSSPSPTPRPGSSMSRRSATPTLTFTGMFSIQRSRSNTLDSLRNQKNDEPLSFEELERKHALMMDDIVQLEHRLKRMSRGVGP